MARIIIINNATEQMLGTNLNASQAMFAAKASLRNVWLAHPGDVIVSLARLDPEFERYVFDTLGIQVDTVRFVRPEATDCVVLNDSFLLDPGMVAQLKAITREGADWHLLPCYHTSGVAVLSRTLELADDSGRRLAEQNGTDLFNRKSHFRQLAAGIGLPIPEGMVTLSGDNFVSAIERLMPVTGKVIAKLDNGAGGTGNFVLTYEHCPPQPGACETVALQSGNRGALHEVWCRLQSAASGPVVVEAYYPASAMFYLEYFITSSGHAEFMNSGVIRLRHQDDPGAPDLFWIGLELPASLPPAAMAQARHEAERFAGLAAAIGYRGHINIDAILTPDDRLLFNEANGRWGGGTVLHEIGERLLGPDFAAKHVVASVRDLPSPGFAQLLALLNQTGLAFDRASGTGVCVLACDDNLTQSFEAVVIAASPEAARQLELRLVTCLKTGN